MVRHRTASVVGVALAVIACSGDRQEAGSIASDPVPSPSAVVTPSEIVDAGTDEDLVVEDGPDSLERTIEGLEHVSTIEHALGSVWAVTSSRPDVFSSGDLRAHVIRIDPETGATDAVVAVSGVEPTLAAAGGRVWVAADDELIALDELGERTGSVPLRLGRAGGLAGTDTLLWATVNPEDRVVGIDPASGAVVHSIDTDRFPAAPTFAFGRVWVPSLIDHSVTIVEPRPGEEPVVTTHPVAEDLKFAVPVTTRSRGDELWLTNDDGELHAVSAETDTLGQVRHIELDRAINSLVVLDEIALLLPIWGKGVVVFDLADETELAEIDIDAIPFRALASHGLFWVSGDGSREILAAIDPTTAAVVATFAAGENESDTTGPRQPITVGDEIWVPNRGSSTIFVVAADEVG